MQNILMKKYKCLINKRESRGLKHFNDSKAFIEYPNDMQYARCLQKYRRIQYW